MAARAAIYGLAYRTVNQVIAVVALFGVVTAVFAPLIAETGQQIFSRSSSVSDAMEASRARAGQTLVATHAHQEDGTITLAVSSVGLEGVRVHAVLVDGADARFVLRDQNGTAADALPAGGLGTLEVEGAGGAVQVIADTGKLFEFYVP